MNSEKAGVVIATGTISGILSGLFFYCLPDNRTSSEPAKETLELGKKPPSFGVPAPQGTPVQLAAQPMVKELALAVPEITNGDKNKDEVVARERAVAAQERERAEFEKSNADHEHARAERERERADKEALLKEAAMRALAEATRKRRMETIQIKNRAKDDEEAAAARKWKLAKQLQTASQEELYKKNNEREATRLIRAYFQTLDEIIEKFPGTHSAEEAKAVYRGDTASNSR
jgi:hypothetical protein